MKTFAKQTKWLSVIVALSMLSVGVPTSAFATEGAAFETAPDGTVKSFTMISRIDTPVEADYYRNGGILHTVLRALA